MKKNKIEDKIENKIEDLWGKVHVKYEEIKTVANSDYHDIVKISKLCHEINSTLNQIDILQECVNS